MFDLRNLRFRMIWDRLGLRICGGLGESGFVAPTLYIR